MPNSTELRRLPGARRRAFTLLEVVVSIAILGGVITALLVARSQAQEKHAIAAQTLTAARLASSQAALLRAGAVGPGEGTFAGSAGYRWRATAVSPTEGVSKDLRKYELRVWAESHEEETAVTLHVWRLVQTAEAAE